MAIKGSHFREFAVMGVFQDSIRGCVFRRRKSQYAIERFFTEALDPENPSEAWKRGLKLLGKGRECPLFLTGPLADGIFFRCSMIELAPRAMREALDMELPQQMLTVPEDRRFQFVAGRPDSEGNVPVNVYVVPGASLEYPAAMLTQAGAKADEYICPLLAVEPGDPPLDLPRFDPDFGFADGEWRPLRISDNAEWTKIFLREFKFPLEGGFRAGDYLECLLAARLIGRGDFKSLEKGLRLLPAELRPRRVRSQLRLTAVLAALLCVTYLWSASGSWKGAYREYSALLQERERISKENTALNIRLKAQEKDIRELARVVNLSPGEVSVTEKLAAFSAVLPSQAMVSSLRWGENSIDMVVQSEEENTDIAAMIRRLPWWKIGQQQQRRLGESVTVITLKLEPVGEGK